MRYRCVLAPPGSTSRARQAVSFLSILIVASFASAFPRGSFGQGTSRGPADEAVASFTISVESDKACLVSIDSRLVYRLQPDTPVSIVVASGQHSITAVTTDGKDFWQGHFAGISDPVNLT